LAQEGLAEAAAYDRQRKLRQSSTYSGARETQRSMTMACHHDAPDLHYRLLHALLCSSGVLLIALLGSSHAQLTLDGSLGPRGALHGPNYTIPDSVGQIRGPNLFHSFGHFNLSQGESATFTGPTTITNILGRVTGGNPETIASLPGFNMAPE